MTTSLQKVSAGLLGGIALLALSGIDARADGAVGVTATCPATGPGIVVCGTVGVLLHEIVQIANGKDGFGPNGEIMKVLAAPVKPRMSAGRLRRFCAPRPASASRTSASTVSSAGRTAFSASPSAEQAILRRPRSGRL
jgi:hypothetical protein